MDTAQVLAYLHAQRDRIVKAIAALEALGWTAAAKLTTSTATKAAALAAIKTAKRVVSPEARQRMAEAQQKRWAKKKRAVKAAAKKASAVALMTPAPVEKAPKKAAPKKAKGGITAAGRKKMSEAAKARWAAKKSAANAPTARKTVSA